MTIQSQIQPPIQLSVNHMRVGWWIVAMAAAVVALGIFREIYIAEFGTGTFLKDLRHIALDSEHCIGAYFSSLLMVAGAVLMVVMSGADAPAGKWKNYWRVLAFIFVCLSIDESVSFHEVLIDPLRGAFGLSGILAFAWIIPAIACLVVMGLFYLRFVLAIRDPLRWQLVIAGTVFVFAAVGLEAVGGYFYTIGGFGAGSYIVTAIIEETLEITGLVILNLALLGELRRQNRVIEFVSA